MLSHSLHILQPLNVDCFSILKCLYSCQVEQFMRLSINHIDKPDFLILYKQACMETYKEETIHNAFKATGLVSYNSIWVLLQLHIEMKTPTPLDSSHGSQSSYWTLKTPQNLQQLKCQTYTVEQHLRHYTISSSSLTKQTINQLIKGCYLAMHNAAFLADENTALHTAN